MNEGIKLINGDCLEAMETEIKGGYDLLLTDPPYYTPAKISSTRKVFRRTLGNMGIFESWFNQFARLVEETINPTAHIYLFCDGRTYPFLYAIFYERTKDCRCLIWDKGKALLGYTWRKQHEIILYAEMADAPTYRTGDGDVFNMPPVPIHLREHPAQKPVELLKRLILKSTKEGDVVFDPFMGVGSTGVAAVETGRRFVGVEISNEFYEIAKDRINGRPKQPSLI